ncbi:MAG: hypothetical protein IBJ11_06010 [Phycisphaerales bacterium]|nr:hypothetical protein [Phycisphaerales bacterium]
MTTFRLATAALALVPAVLAGCARTTLPDAMGEDFSAQQQLSEAEFFSEMSSRGAVSNNEGLHGVFLLIDGNDPANTYAARVAEAKKRGWLSESWDEPANLAMQRGTLARALTSALKIEGGVMMMVFGHSQRYSNRELVYLGIMPEGSAQMALSGIEYSGIIGKAGDYIAYREAQGRSPDPAPVSQGTVQSNVSPNQPTGAMPVMPEPQAQTKPGEPAPPPPAAPANPPKP